MCYPFSRGEQILKNNLLKIQAVGSGWTVLELRFACLQILFSYVSTTFELDWSLWLTYNWDEPLYMVPLKTSNYLIQLVILKVLTI